MSGRIKARFDALAEEGRAALVTFVTAGDPDVEMSRQIVLGLAAAGADLIELGMPFSDPMADGPTIQLSSLRALEAGMSVKGTLELVCALRESDQTTPVVLMGYFNPIYAYGVEAFVRDAAEAGVDGLIIVDLPPEEDEELRLPARAVGIDMIRLATPTTGKSRLPAVTEGAGGFLYFVAITGITGTGGGDMVQVGAHVARIRDNIDLPVAVGFGIKTREDVCAVAKIADAAVVGSAIIEVQEHARRQSGASAGDVAKAVHDFVGELASALR